MATATVREGGCQMTEQAEQTEDAASNAATDPTAPTDGAVEEHATDLLVEEVSIDGLCGVY